jgi:hypothetical protein
MPCSNQDLQNLNLFLFDSSALEQSITVEFRKTTTSVKIGEQEITDAFETATYYDDTSTPQKPYEVYLKYVCEFVDLEQTNGWDGISADVLSNNKVLYDLTAVSYKPVVKYDQAFISRLYSEVDYSRLSTSKRSGASFIVGATKDFKNPTHKFADYLLARRDDIDDSIYFRMYDGQFNLINEYLINFSIYQADPNTIIGYNTNEILLDAGDVRQCAIETVEQDDYLLAAFNGGTQVCGSFIPDSGYQVSKTHKWFSENCDNQPPPGQSSLCNSTTRCDLEISAEGYLIRKGQLKLRRCQYVDTSLGGFRPGYCA